MAYQLFIQAVEALSCKIRDSENVQGIQIDNSEIKITQVADDTTCFVKTKTSLCYLLDIFKQFQCCAGLKWNVDKIKAKILGPESMPPNDLYTSRIPHLQIYAQVRNRLVTQTRTNH